MGLIFVKALFEGLIFGRSIGLALWLEGNLPFLFCFAFFYFVFEGNFQVQALPLPPTPWGGGGAYIWRGDLMEVFLRYKFGGL